MHGHLDGIEDGCRRWWRYRIRIIMKNTFFFTPPPPPYWLKCGGRIGGLLFRHLHP
jgi:hypothetical protein